jgi:GNAT superfamily N-acetyltransferase
MRLRNIEVGDVEVFTRMCCDPAVLAGLGQPLPPEEVGARLRQAVADASTGRVWNLMIVLDDGGREVVAGNVMVWPSQEREPPVSEMGLVVLPEFRGRGLGRAAVRAVVERARDEGRWGVLHAFSEVTGDAINKVARSLEWTLVGEEEVDFGPRRVRAFHWSFDPRALPSGSPGRGQAAGQPLG